MKKLLCLALGFASFGLRPRLRGQTMDNDPVQTTLKFSATAIAASVDTGGQPHLATVYSPTAGIGSTGTVGAEVYGPFAIPAATGRIRPGEDYDMMISANWVSSVTVQFTAPPGYAVEINGDRQESFSYNFSPASGTENTHFLVRLVPEVDPPGMRAGACTEPGNGKVFWHIGLGWLKNGQSAGVIALIDPGTGDWASSSLFQPAGLTYAPPTEEVLTYRTSGGALQQICADQAVVDIEPYPAGSTTSYQINFYNPSQVTNSSFPFTFSGSPYVSYTVAQTTSGANALTLTKQTYNSGGGVVRTETAAIAYNSSTAAWAMTGWATAGVASPVNDNRGEAMNGSARTETATLSDASGTIALQGQKTYQTYAWGDELTQKIGDYQDSSNPNGTNATTGYSYYTDSTQPDYSMLESVTLPTGGWVMYDYYDATDPAKAGQIKDVYRPFGNSPASPQASGEVTAYDYVADWTNVKDLPSSIITTVNGTTVAQTSISYDFSSVTADSQPVLVATRQDYTDAGDYLKTITKTFRDDAPSPVMRGMPWSVQRPDGTQQSWAYEAGDYTPSTGGFSDDANGTAERITVIRGTTNAASGSQLTSWGSFTLDPLYVVTGKSTAQVTIRDASGLVVRTETDVCSTGTTFVPVSWTNYTYDTAGHLTGTTSSNGASTSFSYTGDLLMSQTDTAGTVTTYAYDDADRVVSATKTGVSAAGSYAAQGSLATAYTYDAAGDVTQQVLGSALTTSNQYDQGGRLVQTTAPGNYTTSYSYPNGGRDLAVTYPGGATKTVTNQLDGTPLSITGTAQVEVDYAYSANTTGLFVKQHLGSSSSGNWTSTQTDWLGRKTLTGGPDPSGNTTEVDTTYAYNSAGQLDSVSTPGIAPTLYSYDALGALEMTALDVNGNGLIDLGGTDRISQSDTSYTEDTNGYWWLTTTKSVYATDNSSSPTVTGTTAVRLTGFGTNMEAETDTTDIDGNVTAQTTLVDATNHLVTTTTTTTGVTSQATQVAYNGLMVSSTDVNGVASAYGYDALGRPVSVTDPRTGANGAVTTTYKPGSSQVQQTAYGDGTLIKSYTYGATGQVASVTDAGNGVTNYTYDDQGHVLKVYGSGAIPVSYSYDSFGRLATEATTGQAGAGTTTFNYYGDLPLLKSRVDESSDTVVTQYDALGRVSTRTDARGILTTYSYDPETGDLTKRSYSNDPTDTPEVDYTYTRTGALKTVKDTTGTRTFSYNEDLTLEQEALPSFYNTGGTGRILGYTYDGTSGDLIGRLTGVNLGTAANATADQATGYTYEPATGRLSSVAANGAGATRYTFNYGYVANSDLLVESVANPATGYTQSYAYEANRDWLQTAKSVYGTTVQSQFDYDYNDPGRRSSSTQSGAAFTAYGANPVVYSYGYDHVGELTSALGSVNSVSMSGRQYQYAYDSAGNRESANHTSVTDCKENYTLNTLNQITSKENKAVAVQGSANATGVLVTANGVSTTAGQAGGYWGTEAALANASGPAVGTVSIVAALAGGGPNGTDVVTNTSVNAFIPAASEAMSWDADGNLSSDGTWDYTWNAENELVTMTNLPAQAAGVAAETIQFSYDYLGRRVMKEVNGVKHYYVYNGWNVMAELDSSGNVLRHFIWGLDVSGTMAGAGGIGGLLMIQDSGQTYFPGYDGNGDVATLTNATTGTLAAIYEYTPFGELLQASGSYAAANPFRWSTKWWDQETGYVYYGARYFSPRLGRFLNQDPIQEQGGINLYGFCGNDPVGQVDALGLQGSTPPPQIAAFILSLGSSFWDANSRNMASLDRYMNNVLGAGNPSVGGYEPGMTSISASDGSDAAFPSPVLSESASNSRSSAYGWDSSAQQLALNAPPVVMNPFTVSATSLAPNSAGGESLAWGVTEAAFGGAGDYAEGLLWTGPKGLVTGLYHLVTTNPVTTANNLTHGLSTLTRNLVYNPRATLSAAGKAMLNPKNIGVGVFTTLTLLAPGALASDAGTVGAAAETGDAAAGLQSLLESRNAALNSLNAAENIAASQVQALAQAEQALIQAGNIYGEGSGEVEMAAQNYDAALEASETAQGAQAIAQFNWEAAHQAVLNYGH